MKPSIKQSAILATPFVNIAEKINVVGQNLPWLKIMRNQALDQFKNHGLPSKKIEDWKYTNLWNLAQQQFTHRAKIGTISPSQSENIALLKDAYRLVIVNGIFSNELSQLDNLQKGLTLTPLSTSVERVQHQLGKQVDIGKAGFTALNTMLMNDGAVITVSANTEIVKPIEILVINSGHTENLAVHLRNIIVIECHSKATCIEHYIGLDNHVAMTNVVTEVILDDAAQLDHYKLQQESLNCFHIATIATKQAAHSQWHTNNISLGAKLARNDIHTQLIGEQASTTMNGLYLVNNDQHVDNHTQMEHLVPNTISDELYKGVLNGNSTAVFNGKVMVHKGAQRTDSNQSNRNLLLSRSCEIDTKPEMEIYADNVKCTHSSTVGQIDENQMFYLRSRGLDEMSACTKLTHAFTDEILECITSTDIKQSLATIIAKHTSGELV